MGRSISSFFRAANNPGDRIKWVREKLSLSCRDVCSYLGIPEATYYFRERGSRAINQEEIKEIADYFNSLWMDKYKVDFPCKNGEEIKEITFEWIILGKDNRKDEIYRLREQYQGEIRKLEIDHFMKVYALKYELENLEDTIRKLKT